MAKIHQEGEESESFTPFCHHHISKTNSVGVKLPRRLNYIVLRPHLAKEYCSLRLATKPLCDAEKAEKDI